MRRLLRVVCWLLVALLVTGCGQAGTVPSSPPVAGIPYAAGQWEYTVRPGVARHKTLGAASYAQDTAKGEYVVVGVTVKNIGQRNVGIRGRDFALYDGKNVRYDPATSVYATAWAKANGYDGGVLNIASGQLPPGVPVTYAIVFDVTPGTTGLRLRLNLVRVDVPLE